MIGICYERSELRVVYAKYTLLLTPNVGPDTFQFIREKNSEERENKSPKKKTMSKIKP